MLKYKVLCVDDNIEIQEYMNTILKNYFSKVYISDNGLEALEIFKNNSIDLVVTDINMPKMDGLELIKNIKDIDDNIRVIILSAHSDSYYFTESIRLGIDGYLLKPVDLVLLDSLISKITKSLEDNESYKKNTKLLNEYKDAMDMSTIITKSNIDGKITYVNDAFTQLTGYSKYELIGNNHNIVRHPDTSLSIFKDMWNTILNKKIWKGIIKNKKKNGEHYWVNMTITPILDANDNIFEFIAIRNNITVEIEYRMNLEQTVRDKIEQLSEKEKLLHHQSKLASMGEMIDAIAHQWKQPINSIKMNTDMLGYDYKDGLLDDKVLKTFQDTVYSQVNHMVNTLEEFRSFLRPNKSVKEFNVTKTVDGVLLLVKDEFVNNMIKVNICIVDEIIINGIENEFKHVILNIINNSKDAFIQNSIENRIIDITVKKKKKKNIISIQDNAGGIPLNIINTMFEAHVTTKDMATGTGIGLYMSTQIIEKIGANISVENKNDGACFTISI